MFAARAGIGAEALETPSALVLETAARRLDPTFEFGSVRDEEPVEKRPCARRDRLLPIPVVDRLEKPGGYNSIDADLYVDRSLGNGDAISLQADIVRYDGGSTFPNLGRQTTSLAEGGYLFRRTHLAPFVQLAAQRFESDAGKNQDQMLFGIAYFPRGQKLNVKFAAGRSRLPLGRRSTVAQVSLQAFAY